MLATVAMCEWSPVMRGRKWKAQSFSRVAAAPNQDFIRETK
jgi:hypothetical protein